MSGIRQLYPRTWSRRAFLCGLLLGPSLATASQISPVQLAETADSIATPDIEAIRRSLSARDRRIRTAYVDFHIDAGPAIALTGRTELYFSDGRYHIRHHRGGATMTEILNGRNGYQYTTDPDGNRQHERRSRARRRGSASLEMFLPSLSRTPAHLLPSEPDSRHGTSLVPLDSLDNPPPNRLLCIAQGDNVLWFSPTTGDIVQHRHFRETKDGTESQTLTFLDFVDRDGIGFPTKILAASSDGLRNTVIVNHVELNAYVDPLLFTIPLERD